VSLTLGFFLSAVLISKVHLEINEVSLKLWLNQSQILNETLLYFK